MLHSATVQCQCGTPRATLEQCKSGLVWVCACGRWVKAHDNSPTNKPMGIMVDDSTRTQQVIARVMLTSLWSALMNRRVQLAEGFDKRSRRDAYEWLAKQLAIPAEDCDFAWFDQQQCQRAIEIINQHSPSFMEFKA